MTRVLLLMTIILALACSKSDLKQPSQVPPSAAARPVENAADTAPSPDTSLFALDSVGDTLRIVRIEAHLIYDDGQVSDNIIGAHPWTLWNTIIGEGDAHKPSNATEVRVIVSGPPNDSIPGAAVELVISASEGPQTNAVRQTNMVQPLGRFDSTGVRAVAFHLSGTGCIALSLEARLTAASANVRGQAYINFACGE